MEFISGIVDFEMFRPILESKLQTAERKSNAGRPPIDPVLMFKVMFVQRLGLIVNEGKIIDASFVVSPRQRNTREENKRIKKGEGDSL